MRRPHRRAHFLIWLALAPATMIAAVLFWQERPEDPLSDLPDAIKALDEGTG